MADKAQKDMEQALTSLVEHPGWAHVVAYAEITLNTAMDAMTANPAGRIWEHGVQRGVVDTCYTIVGYPAKALEELRKAQQAKDEEDDEA